MTAGRKYLVTTRPPGKFTSVVDRKCFRILNIPVTDTVVEQSVADSIREILEFGPDAMVFTSRIGSEVFMKHGGEEVLRRGLPCFCIGPSTAGPLELSSGDILIPDSRDTAGLSDLVISRSQEISRVAVFRSREGNPALMDALKSAIQEVREYEAYHSIELEGGNIEESVTDEKCVGIALTSPMEADIFFRRIRDPAGLRGKRVFAIGNPTAEKVRSHGFEVSEPLGKSDFEALILEIENIYCGDSGEWI